MDETAFRGRSSSKCGWGPNGKCIVFGIYPRETKKFLTFPISDRDRETMMPFITEYTKIRSSILYR